MYQLVKHINFCYAHRLLNYEGKCKHLHGHNAVVEIEVTASTLDDRGMIIDFGDIKSIAKQWLDTHLDHKLLLCDQDPLVPLLHEAGEPIYLMSANPTAEAIAKEIYDALSQLGLPITKINLWETPSSCASYRSS